MAKRPKSYDVSDQINELIGRFDRSFRKIHGSVGAVQLAEDIMASVRDPDAVYTVPKLRTFLKEAKADIAFLKEVTPIITALVKLDAVRAKMSKRGLP